MLYHIVAVANNRVIGKANQLPWHFSKDLQHFKKTTTGQTVIMGLKTFESLGCKPLPGRENIILDRSGQKPYPGQTFFSSLDDALKHVKTEHAFIIGGAELYRTSIDRVDGLYITRIHADFDGDVFYPEIPPAFKEMSRFKLQDDPALEVIYYEKATVHSHRTTDHG
ncbi:MAG TPA: dihydrofolate reductase [Candidatus Omnitrophota bacterium]|nr:dihydrofolate reductase [Candidatus Omnitrophota bacterium]HRY85021.1 dihydrofolate reductase [Candidatus Omnitrophota bacterium]